MAQPPIIKKNEIKEFICEYLNQIKEFQLKHENDDEIIYSFLSINLCVKNKMYLSAILLHPITIKVKKFYEDNKVAENNQDFYECITKIIEYEVTSDTPFLTIPDRDHLIQWHKKMQLKISK